MSAICPGFVDTPLLTRVNPDLPATSAGAEVAGRVGKLYKVGPLARDVLRGIERNRALIIAPRSARMAWRVARYAPNLTLRTASSLAKRAGVS